MRLSLNEAHLRLLQYFAISHILATRNHGLTTTGETPAGDKVGKSSFKFTCCRFSTTWKLHWHGNLLHSHYVLTGRTNGYRRRHPPMSRMRCLDRLSPTLSQVSGVFSSSTTPMTSGISGATLCSRTSPLLSGSYSNMTLSVMHFSIRTWWPVQLTVYRQDAPHFTDARVGRYLHLCSTDCI